ncbi:MAG: sigma-54-dependent Fis family transcriptional regulator [Gemmatimonadetes bacterium]|nr:sigma-54-dependent Fis family transcriptional regulator [Gemmatimonadota bacterium]
MKRILIVDPDSKYRGRARGALESLQCDVVTLDSAEEAIRIMMEEVPALVIAGCDEPQEADLNLLRIARKGAHPVPVLVLANQGSTRGAIDFMDAGAYDYVAKPGDPVVLLEVVQDILRLSGERRPQDVAGEPEAYDAGKIIGRSPEMIEIYKLIGRIAKSDAAVLVQGESGTGKELVARTIHENSRRANKPFLAVNCAAIPETLLESELFGHEKGAFTGATYSRKGKFEQCHGGTIFLDEVGDMSLPTQAKILRVLQEHTFERVGGEQTLTADTRIIAATNKSLVDGIDQNEFRVDLFYRLKVVSIFLPSLAKRPGDLPLLVDHFMHKYRVQAKTPIRGISRRAHAFLARQPWAGNVRELENAIQTAVVLNRTGTLCVEDFPFLQDKTDGGGGAETAGDVLGRLRSEAAIAARALLAEGGLDDDGPYRRCVGEVERTVVETALELFGGNQVRASKALGISRNTLRSKIASVDRETGRP